jgi:YidC/Oxa1 family membrane protein insertase
MQEQRKLAPQMAELSKKYKKDPQRLNAERMKLMQEHGVNPYGMLLGCLPLVVQLPILTALYYVFTTFAKKNDVIAHFLFVPNLNDNPSHHELFAGLPIPTLVYLVFPLLAGITTLVQSRMLQMPPTPNPTEQEQQTQQMQRTMLWISPLMIGYFALQVPAGLGLYWFVGNLVSIIQQSFVVGWGSVLPARFKPVAGGAPTSNGKGLANGPPNKPKKAPPTNGPPNKPKKGPPTNGPYRPKKPKRPGKE